MWIWESLRSTADTLHRSLPDPSPVKDFGWGFAQATASTVSAEAIRARDLLHWAADKARSGAPDLQQTKRIAWDLADYGLAHATKPYTAGIPVYRIVKEGWTKGRSGPVVHVKEEEEELQDLRNRIARLEMAIVDEERPGPHGRRAASDRVLDGLLPHQKPEDVIRVYMMKGFKGGDFIDAQVVPRAGNAKRTPY
ncbi:uncharacterized protein LOC108511721 [Phoenix dactylifera]|uniref:Uncharacterized protein LOC108511721 n=1 Tax=Phoenix dactylifera TaxID=42345 RepID=A0A8B7MX56_PHODC|nr:uncharacterized protein LOC108511721 [Phoenix dactylifera]